MSSVVLFGLLLAVGAGIGFLGGLVGIGGGLLAIPFLVLTLGFEQQTAQGTALIMVLPAVLLTLLNYHKQAPIPLKQAFAGASTSVIFTWLGAQFALGIAAHLLQQIYAAFVLSLAVYYFYHSRTAKRVAVATVSTPKSPEVPVYYFMFVGMIAGTAGGVFAVGGSVVVVPLLTTLFKFSQFRAQALGLTMVVPGIIVALITYGAHGQVAFFSGLPLAIGSLVLVPYGVRLAYALAERRLKFIFALTLLGISFLLYYSSQ